MIAVNKQVSETANIVSHLLKTIEDYNDEIKTKTAKL